MRKIAVALTKGGVGKTTTAVNLAAGLALAGRKVLLIDVDTQGQAGQSLGVAAQAGLAELVAGDGAPDQLTAMARDNLYVLAGGKSLAGLKRVIARKDFGGERTLAEALAALDGRYDYVIVDTAPGWDVLTVNVLFYVDEVLAPVSLEVMTLQGLTEFSQSMASIQRYRDGLALRYVLPTFMDLTTLRAADIVLAAVLTLVALMAGLMLISVGAARARRFFRSARATRLLNRSAGAIMIGAGAWLATRH